MTLYIKCIGSNTYLEEDTNLRTSCYDKNIINMLETEVHYTSIGELTCYYSYREIE